MQNRSEKLKYIVLGDRDKVFAFFTQNQEKFKLKFLDSSNFDVPPPLSFEEIMKGKKPSTLVGIGFYLGEVLEFYHLNPKAPLRLNAFGGENHLPFKGGFYIGELNHDARQAMLSYIQRGIAFEEIQLVNSDHCPEELYPLLFRNEILKVTQPPSPLPKQRP